MKTIFVLATVFAVFAVTQSRNLDESANYDNFLKKVQEHHKVANSREKRQASTTTTCPYCHPDVWAAYPDWTDCTSFVYCYGGTVNTYSCNAVMGAASGWYFNPTTKVCENSQEPDNSCFFRSFDLRTV